MSLALASSLVSSTPPLLAVFPKSAKKCEMFSGIFAQIFHKCETACNSGVFRFEKRETVLNSSVFLFFLFVWRCAMTIFAKAESTLIGSRCDDLFFFLKSPCKWQKIPGLRRDDLFFEITCVVEYRRCEKAASQSLINGIFAKTSGTLQGTWAHFRRSRRR